MIVIDSSVWIDHFNGADNDPRDRLVNLLQHDVELLLGDVIMQEVLQGFATDEDFAKALTALSVLPCASVLTPLRAIAAARNYRLLRAIGITVRKATDVAIATFCIEEGHVLLHNDRDFDPFEQHLGLQVLR